MNKKITYFLTVLLLGTVLFSEVFAGGAKRNGTAGAQELLIPSSPSGLALNGANISSVTGLDAVFYNPAGFGGTQSSTETMFSHLNYIADISMSFAAVGVSFSDLGSLAFSLRTLNFGDIPVTTVDNPYGTGSTFSPSFVTLGLTYANSLTDRIRVGVNLKLVSEKIIRTSATGFALDAGIQYQGLAGLDGLNFGITLKNLGPQMKYDGPDLIRVASESEAKRGDNFYSIDAASFELPSQLELGLSYAYSLGDQYKLGVATAFQNNNFANDEYKFGGEFVYDEMLFLRGGYAYMGEVADNEYQQFFGVTAGIGVKVNIGLEMVVDYAYRAAKFSESNHLIGVKFNF
ncbi:MAG: hypothetical protein COT22_10430 [Ignavibacteria bacterium CG08_land_8_20_14_0_20_37_9]|nr:PorV/PorQ family protein [Ignavibacteria bacterium]OIO21876.1 MAG: hypothetical protein AUJ54_04160 [Ignavibacteria bacterium CG1_02_37_35]PIS44480.1 MAG: hypothetical protein COT22_10430 [Ignavibacteria bacterium CG08_land_8_20_14_0_20_37_9]